MSPRRTLSSPIVLLGMLLLAPCAPNRLRAQVRDTVRRDSMVSRDTATHHDSATVHATAQRSAADSAMQRARQLVTDGDGAAGRALADSVVARTSGTPEYPDALYWRGTIAATAADAERDYRRVVVEYPFSAHAGEALFALAQLEMARGDRSAASDHLQRFLLEHPDSPQRLRAGFWLGRMRLEQNELPRGCAVLLRTRAAVPDSEAELRNQIDYYTNRCAGVDTASAPAPAAPPAPARAAASTPPRRDTTAPSGATNPPRAAATERPTGTKPGRGAPASSGMSKRYTVQVAAYGTRAAAERLTARLAARGLAARVVSAGAAPYRVRIGSYATEREAAVAARQLRTKGISGFVASEMAPERGRP